MMFYKYHGTGNDFIIVHDVDEEQVSNLCQRRLGIGADGLILVKPSEKADIKMVYYNQDGKKATMCGNGLRCFTRYVHEMKLISKEQFKVETDAGMIAVGIEKSYEEVWLELPRDNQGIWYEIEAKTKVINCYYIFTGTPHAVVFDESHDLAEMISSHQAFQHRVNVNFVEKIKPNQMTLRTYENGVGWTLSCGTGAIASVIAAHEKGFCGNEVNVNVPGGKLNVFLKEKSVILKGPATFVAKGWYADEFI